MDCHGTLEEKRSSTTVDVRCRLKSTTDGLPVSILDLIIMHVFNSLASKSKPSFNSLNESSVDYTII